MWLHSSTNTMQSKKQLNEWYAEPDPWGYEAHVDDKIRKSHILLSLPKKKYKRALDIGCGEGFITKDLPAKKIYGYDLANVATERLPENVIPVKKKEIEGEYDLIIATGVLYPQYNWQSITSLIQNHANGIVLTSNIKEWEINELDESKQILVKEFPYREFTQILRVYDYS